MTPEKLLKNFCRCSDWEERYLYLIELGEKLPEFPAEKRSDAYLAKGCQSQVWLDVTQDSNSGRIEFQATSDAAIVQGLLALLRVAYQDRTPEEIQAFDIEAWFEALQLKDHLTPTRTQGLEAIVSTVRTRFAK
ncbi:cysteine desulfuration protein SufE [Vibrio sp. JC009]|uniref:cysteine desulfuration protein SufE n=1 Tax=Vibrio sp. JC009 TaxID=2912314 RepID=UPI0023B08D3E|nr:cysteine desulfuration protein SufE [Vibrio sp. JC009]WED23973.1 cysteine desulfuration protein SufE [Vibrio sp. JC009]